MNISNRKVIIAAHYLVYGAPQALKDYLMVNKIKKLFFIAHPLSNDGSFSYIEKIVKGNIAEKNEIIKRYKSSILNYFFEIYLTLRAIIKSKEKFDLFVGVDSLNTFAGLLLRKIRYVKKVIFYTIDYVPERFNNKILNSIYHRLDKFCVKNADETWNVSPRIAEGRERIKGLKQCVYNKQKVVPIGVWFDKAKRLPFYQIKKCQLLFIGHLLEKQGVQLVLDAIPEIIKSIPDFHFLIIGGGKYEKNLVDKVEKLGIKKYITFTGWIKARNVLDKMMTDSAIAVAMYDRQIDTFTYYADPTKLKDYLSVGLPILLTDVSYNAREIEENRCGKIINYDKESITKAVIELMSNENRLQEYRL